MMMKEWEGTEAEALEDSGFMVALVSDEDDEREHSRQRRPHVSNKRKYELQTRYKMAAGAPVGSVINCPWCRKQLKKTTYHKVFCSNQKTVKRGKSNCKDNYHNAVNPRGYDA